MRKEVAYFTSFYSYSLTRGLPYVLHARTWPRSTRFDDRWGWIVGSVVGRFRRFDADPPQIDASLRRILADAQIACRPLVTCPADTGRNAAR